MGSSDEFYVGYLEQAPPGIGRFAKLCALGLIVLSLGLGAWVTSEQRHYGNGTFEFGVERRFEGWLELDPHPVLAVPRPASDEVSRYLLSGFGKAGAEAEFAGRERGDFVRLIGSAVYRDGEVMVEVAAGSVELGEPPLGRGLPASVDLGQVQLVGEIADSKCYLGVMDPGFAAPHRACAVRCLSGGVPPVLIQRHPDGSARTLLIVGPDGEAIGERLLDRVAEPVEVNGRLERRGDQLVLFAAPEAFKPIGR
jgi:hypothetical protein